MVNSVFQEIKFVFLKFCLELSLDKDFKGDSKPFSWFSTLQGRYKLQTLALICILGLLWLWG